MIFPNHNKPKRQLTRYFLLLRPFTLLAPIIVSSSVMVASLIYTGRNDLTLLQIMYCIIAASFSFALLNGASNALNQATDIHEDSLSKPYRPIPKGRLSPKEAHIIAMVLYFCAVLLASTVHVTFLLFVLFISVFTITYSIQPRMKKRLVFNQLWVALPRGLLAIMASWSVFGNPFHRIPVAIGCIAALFLFGGTTTKDILDADADKQTGINTLINVLGVKKTALIAFLCMSTAFTMIIPLVVFHILEIYLLPLVFLILLASVIAWLMIHQRKNEKYENTSAWTLMYATYLIFALSFAGLTIFFS